MNLHFAHLERIEFVVTNACTGRCRHCSEGEHKGSGEHIDPGAAARAVRDLCGRYSIASLMTFGGEPMLYPETTAAIHEEAKKCGIPKRQLITNGFFSKEERRIREVAGMLARAGVNDLLLSVDAFHQETIPLEPVLSFARGVRDAGVPLRLSPAWLVRPEEKNPYNEKTREVLEVFRKEGFPEGRGNIVFPEGNARVWLKEYFEQDKEYVNPYEEDPEDVRCISFCANGDVAMLRGNLYTTPILEILEAYVPAKSL